MKEYKHTLVIEKSIRTSDLLPLYHYLIASGLKIISIKGDTPYTWDYTIKLKGIKAESKQKSVTTILQLVQSYNRSGDFRLKYIK